MINEEKLARELQDKYFPNLSLGKLELILDALEDVIIAKVKQGEVVRLSRFGSFRKITRKPSKFKNPATGEMLDIPARGLVKFRPATSFKALVR